MMIPGALRDRRLRPYGFAYWILRKHAIYAPTCYWMLNHR